MKVFVNDVQLDVATTSSVADIVDGLVASRAGVAVAVDREVVPRSQWEQRLLVEGARIEVLEAAAGG